MARRRRVQEPENHERWLVSYADFITLLFAFFVVMYAVSSVNEGKMRVLSDTLMSSFSGRQKSLSPIQIGELVRSRVVDDISPITRPGIGSAPRFKVDESQGRVAEAALTEPVKTADQETGDESRTTDAQEGGAEKMAHMDAVADQVEASMAPLIDDELVSVRRNDRWLEVELKSSLLFSSGEATLAPSAYGVLRDLAAILDDFPNPIQVEGFTDNIPISTPQFPSNWELSAARAASVVGVFARFGIRPDRMAAVGYGEHRPIAENLSSEGRSKNRRVVLVIPAERAALRELELGRLSGESSASGLNTVQPWAESPSVN